MSAATLGIEGNSLIGTVIGIVIFGIEDDVVIDTTSEVVTEYEVPTATDGDSLIDTVSEVVLEYEVATVTDGDSLIDTVSEVVLCGIEGDVVIDTTSEGVATLLAAYIDVNVIVMKTTMIRNFFGNLMR